MNIKLTDLILCLTQGFRINFSISFQCIEASFILLLHICMNVRQAIPISTNALKHCSTDPSGNAGDFASILLHRKIQKFSIVAKIISKLTYALKEFYYIKIGSLYTFSLLPLLFFYKYIYGRTFLDLNVQHCRPSFFVILHQEPMSQ